MHEESAHGDRIAARTLAAWRAYASLTASRATREGRTPRALYLRAIARVAALVGVTVAAWAMFGLYGVALVGIAG
jgi:hypothetical protein